MKSFNTPMKVFYLFYPNCVVNLLSPLPCLYRILANGGAETSRNHNTTEWGPSEPDYADWANLKVYVNVIFLLQDVVTLWWSLNLLTSHKSQPKQLNSLWWIERWSSWGHWWAVFTLGYQSLILHLLSMSDRNKEKLIEEKKSNQTTSCNQFPI